MSLFNWGSSPEDEHQSDIVNGTSVLEAYFSEASMFLENFKFGSSQEFIDYLAGRGTPPENIGELVRLNSASTTVGEALDRARDLARKSRGAATVSQIVRAAGGSGDTINWLEAAPEIIIDTGRDLAKQTGEVLQAVGTGTLGTLKLVKYLPWLALGGGAIYLFVKAGGVQAVAVAARRGKGEKQKELA